MSFRPLLQHLLLGFLPLAAAQYLPQTGTQARNLTVVNSPADDNITVSYKIPEGVCNTAFDTQQQYTGWVNVPGDYPTNLFFWFVAARQATESLTIWLNGGPGSSSMYGFFTGNGPCEVIVNATNDFDTVARDYGWDRESNMLFIDQPNQVGFSYDTPSNGTINFINSTISSPVANDGSFPDWAMLNGTFSSQNANFTANTTELAAMAVWHLLQGFLTTFPQYLPADNASVAVNLFAESYGGRYGPIFAETFDEQNAKRLTGEVDPNSTVEVRLTSLGIVNGCVDMEIQTPYYPAFAVNNTYNTKVVTQNTAEFYLSQYNATGGCKDLLAQCETAAIVSDPDGDGNVSTVNTICAKALQACNTIQEDVYGSSGRSFYDLSADSADPYPPLSFLDYLNQADVLAKIGSPINYTMNSWNSNIEFAQTGDMARDGNIPRLAALLQKGVRVGLIYGDRDYICNWMGGEAVSKSLAWETNDDYGTKFSAAGYAPIVVNTTYVGGVVRQYGNLSFSRIYQAGHAAAAYQPQTVFEVFARIILGTSVSLGQAIDLSEYNTTGDANATHTDKLPNPLEPTCYIRAFQSSCDNDAIGLADKDEGTVLDGILYSTSTAMPTSTTARTSTTTQASSTENLTGVFTATTTPNAGIPVRSPEVPAAAIIAGLVALKAVA